MKKATLKSHAKINLGLNIIRKRSDGFHDIETIFYPLELCDYIEYTVSDAFRFTCSNEALSADIEGNLIVKAVRLLEGYAGKQIQLNIHLEKHIPMGAGLGGGSSNAAVTLLAVNELLQLHCPDKKLAEFALMLGSDVPYFLKLRPAFAESRGEKLRYFSTWLKKHIVLVNPGIHVATGWAYANVTPTIPKDRLASLNYGDDFLFETHYHQLSNDFEQPVFQAYPEIGAIKSKLLDCGAEYASMSGSGSTVFGIFDDIVKAEQAEKAMQSQPFVYLDKFEE